MMRAPRLFIFFFFNDTATTEIYTLSLHDALPISSHPKEIAFFDRGPMDSTKLLGAGSWSAYWYNGYIIRDRKSTRLNSSHSQISYAVFCLKKKKKIQKSSGIARTVT